MREILDGLLDVVFRDELSSAMARGRAHLSKRESFFSVFASLSRLFVTKQNEVTMDRWKKVIIERKTRMFFQQ